MYTKRLSLRQRFRLRECVLLGAYLLPQRTVVLRAPNTNKTPENVFREHRLVLSPILSSISNDNIVHRKPMFPKRQVVCTSAIKLVFGTIERRR